MCQTIDYTIFLKLDYDDFTSGEVIDWAQDNKLVYGLNGPIHLCLDFSQTKIYAINRDIERARTKWDILVNMSDDMSFIKKGFDQRIISAFAGDYDKFLHYPDQHTGQAICTMSIIGKDYYARDGYVYHPDYQSLWCDNEATEVAINRGKYYWINENIYEHRHPAWGFGKSDDQLKKSESHFYIDQDTFNKRKSLGFPKESIF